ncbi:MAG: glucosyltransferase domain-containing protein, partial [Lachnospiraceae bacterium]|nr:glucosyltransferase domain-containing protein [Lachnospiraceae bacterium]
YRFFNSLFSGDALLMIYQNDAAWQIALGRVGQPFLVFLRGGITSPFLISILAAGWISCAVVITVHLLRLKNYGSIVLTAAVMASHISLIAANANFLPWVDFYAFALFLAVFGVWLIRRKRVRSMIAGVVSLAFCLSVYQAYICVAIGLFMILLLLDLTEETTWKVFLKKSLLSAGALFAGALVYVVFWKVIQKSLHIWTADSYNGLASVGDYSKLSVGTVLGLTYRNVFSYFWEPISFITMTFREKDMSIVWIWLQRIGNILLIAAMIVLLRRLNRRTQTAVWQKVFQTLLLVVFPLGINFVCFLSQGMEHSLMTYAFCLVPVLAVALTDRQMPEQGSFIELPPEKEASISLTKRLAERIMRCTPAFLLLAAILGMQIWCHIVYANQVYLQKQAQERAAQSLMSRIETDITHAQGYIPGETPVAFTGSFETSPYIKAQEAFSTLQTWGTAQTALSYIGTDYAYLNYFENMKMNLTRVDAQDERVKEMPCYPVEGSVAYIDGILVVKISD